MKTAKKNGRPTSWTPELNEKLIQTFGTEDRWEDRISMEITKKNGETVTRYDRFPKPVPWFGRFEFNNGLSIGILSKWAEEEEKLLKEGKPESKPGFLQAYKFAKEAQKEYLVQNGIANIANASVTIFTLKNVSDMRDKVETDVTSNGNTINVMTFGAGDPLAAAIAKGEKKAKTTIDDLK